MEIVYNTNVVEAVHKTKVVEIVYKTKVKGIVLYTVTLVYAGGPRVTNEFRFYLCSQVKFVRESEQLDMIRR